MRWVRKSNENEKAKAGHRSIWPNFLTGHRAPSCIMENRGQHPSLNVLFKIATLLEISIDQFFFPAQCDMENERRKHIDLMLDSMGERELTIMEAAAEGIVKSREVEAR